jgi:hypothetical protein
VAPSRRLLPYLLLAVITLGAGLGAGLGLAQGPQTCDPGHSAPTSATSCVASRRRDEAIVSCSSKVSPAYSSTITFTFFRTPKGQACLTKTMKAPGKAVPSTLAPPKPNFFDTAALNWQLLPLVVPGYPSTTPTSDRVQLIR